MYSPPRPSRATRRRALPAGIVCGALSAVLLALVAVGWTPLMSLDRTVAEALHRSAVAAPGAVRVNRVLTDWVWDPWTMRALIAVVVIALWRRGARVLAVRTAVTCVAASLLQQGIKAAVGRERPRWPDPVDSAQYAAFPSGHVMTATVSCGLLLWLLRLSGAAPALWWAGAAVAVVTVTGVSFTRLYLGVHWLSDVLGGFLLGATAVAFCAAGHPGRRAAPGGAVPRL
ncbi:MULTISPECIES: phosphatase PAP2 family protein [Streptomyces]|uniref:Phosphatase PAP2 family protein n=1 Tax=Streptomyces flavovirens TaxID=52258 RepID=A0ABV8MZQ4_9ACTN|nr:phosphatase PAP2 family protein [Streptomyces sp. MBT51]MBK3594616.1 phosphatase PAP2 family protein [Streptomyces sp. MBT51]